METGENKFISTSQINQNPIIPKGFSADKAYNCVLQLSIANQKLQFSIVDKSEASLIAVGEKLILASELEEVGLPHLTTEWPFLRFEFSQVIVSFDSPDFTFIPLPFFEEKLQHKYLSLNHKISSGNAVSHDVIRSQEAVLVYTFPKKLKEKLQSFFGKGFYLHQVSSNVEALGLQSKGESGVSAFLGLEKENLKLSLFKDGKLLLHNHFYVEDEHDVLYYTLYSLEQFKVLIEQVKFQVYGTNSFKEETVLKFKKYTTGLTSLAYPGFVNISAKISIETVNHYFGSLNGFLCV